MKLLEFMHSKGLTYKEMAVQAKCDPRYLSQVIKGKYKPSQRLAVFIETLTEGKVSADSLLRVYERNGEKKEKSETNE